MGMVQERLKFGVLFGVLGLVVALLFAHFGPIVLDQVRPASRWFRVIEAKVDNVDLEAGAFTYTWNRWVQEDIVVDTYLDMIKDNHADQQVWSAEYVGIFYEAGDTGEYCFEFIETGLPQLQPGEYKILGLTVFRTPRGVEKRVSFEFAPFFVSE